MAAQALYRTWRPQTYSEVSGQEHVTQTLHNALTQEQIAHAYLFAGPRGTGKTSTARILAKAVNCLADEEMRPCNTCARCLAINEGRLLDLVEIDAASNRGIDEVRDLREKVGFVPNEARFKVYILDEAHMLTVQAFNALLKTLEEPPPHVIFVLVTTEAYNIPLTIRSRCQRFDFRPIARPQIVERLQEIVREEGLSAERAALETIASSATGSMRDAIGLLDQLRSFGTEAITQEQVRKVVGGVSEHKIQQLIEALIDGDVPAGLALMNDASWQGVEVRQFLRQVVEYLRQLLLIEVGGRGLAVDLPEEMVVRMSDQAAGFGRERLLQVVHIFTQAGSGLRAGFQSYLPAELAFIEAAAQAEEPSRPVVVPDAESVAAAARAPARVVGEGHQVDGVHDARTIAPARTEQQVVKDSEPVSATRATAERVVSAVAEPSEATQVLSNLQARWEEVLAEVRGQDRYKAEAALRGSEPVAVEKDVVTIAFQHEFAKSMIEEADNLRVVEAAVTRIVAQPTRVRCVLQSDWALSAQARQTQQGGGVEQGHRRAGGQEDDGLSRAEGTRDPVVEEAIAKYGGQLKSQSTGR